MDGSSLSLEERRAIVRKGKKVVAMESGADGLDEEVKKTKSERMKEAKQLKKRLKQENQQEDAPSEQQQSIPSIAEDDSVCFLRRLDNQSGCRICTS